MNKEVKGSEVLAYIVAIALACVAIGVLTSRAQSWPPNGPYIATTLGGLPAANTVSAGTTAIVGTTPNAVQYYSDGTIWATLTGYIPGTFSLTMPSSLSVLGPGATQSVSIPNAVSFEWTPTANPNASSLGAVSVNCWITGQGTSGALANCAYSSSLAGLTIAPVTIAIKPFSK